MAKDRQRLTWGGNQQAQREADAAFRKLKASQKPTKAQKPKRHKKRRKQTYARYMASKEWRIRRQEAITTHLDRCDVCGAKESLRVSHRHFKTLYNEMPHDLDVLCPDCHDNKYEGRHATVYDPITAEYLSRMADA